MLCSWHELLARMYYEKTLNLRDRIYFYKVKTFATLSTLILTYGVIIILVGFLEIFFRNIPHAWSMACYIMAGVFLLFFLVNIFLPPRRPLHLGISASESSLYGSVKTDARILDRMMRRKYSMRTFFFMFILLYKIICRIRKRTVRFRLFRSSVICIPFTAYDSPAM